MELRRATSAGSVYPVTQPTSADRYCTRPAIRRYPDEHPEQEISEGGAPALSIGRNIARVDVRNGCDEGRTQQSRYAAAAPLSATTSTQASCLVTDLAPRRLPAGARGLEINLSQRPQQDRRRAFAAGIAAAPSMTCEGHRVRRRTIRGDHETG